jgi:hypothetical protein
MEIHPNTPDLLVGQGGTSQTLTKKLSHLFLKVLDTGFGLQAGPNDDFMMPAITKRGPMYRGQLYTRVVQVEYKGDYDEDPPLIIRQRSPYPATILGIYPKLTAS